MEDLVSQTVPPCRVEPDLRFLLGRKCGYLRLRFQNHFPPRGRVVFEHLRGHPHVGAHGLLSKGDLVVDVGVLRISGCRRSPQKQRVGAPAAQYVFCSLNGGEEVPRLRAPGGRRAPGRRRW